MIDEIFKILLDLCDWTIRADTWGDETYYYILWSGEALVHFWFLREIEAVARMNNYDVYVNKNGIELHPGG